MVDGRSPDASACREATATVDSGHPEVRVFAERAAAGVSDDRAPAVCLHYAVRDGIRYDPYGIALDVER